MLRASWWFIECVGLGCSDFLQCNLLEMLCAYGLILSSFVCARNPFSQYLHRFRLVVWLLVGRKAVAPISCDKKKPSNSALRFLLR